MENFLCDLNKEHILFDPRVLNCGATACLECIKTELARDDVTKEIFTCSCCGHVHDIRNAGDLPKNTKIEHLMRRDIQLLSQQMVKNFEKSFRECNRELLFFYF
jgi:hypothetical protein